MKIGDLVRGVNYPHNRKMGIIIEHHWAFTDEEQDFLVCWGDGSISDAGEYSLEVVNESR